MSSETQYRATEIDLAAVPPIFILKKWWLLWPLVGLQQEIQDRKAVGGRGG